MKFYTVDRGEFLHNTTRLELLKRDPLERIVYSLEGFHSQRDSIEHINKLFPDGLSMHGWQYILNRHDFIKTQDSSIFWDHSTSVELLFESIRRERYGHVQSRFQSYFAWLNLEDAINFCPPGKKVYEVEAENFHIGDMKLLTMSVQGAIALLYGNKYWNSEFTNNPQKEVLLKPPVIIGPVVYEASL